jgi:hypothetical protein
VVTKFIKDRGFKAQDRRRDESFTAVGVSLEDIQEHIKATIPGAKELGVSVSTIARLFNPKNVGHRSARLYTGQINASVPVTRNDSRKKKPDAHAAFTCVAHGQEFGAAFPTETAQASLDGMSNILINNAAAVSRHHQLNRFVMEGDGPNFLDHDFNTGGYVVKTQGIRPSSTSQIATRGSCTQPSSIFCWGRAHQKSPHI